MVTALVRTELPVVVQSPKRRRRSDVLLRLLGLADVNASALAGLLAGLIGGLGLTDALLVALVAAVTMPIMAFVSGLYAPDDLRAWVTGTHEIKRILFSTLALSWMLNGVAAEAAAASPAAVAAVGSLLTVVLVVTARAGVRAYVHRCDHLQERLVIVGSGYVAGQMVGNLRRHPELGLIPVGIVEDPVHHRSVSDVPHLGALDDLAAIVRENAVDRVIIAFTRGSHLQLLQVIRVCRDARVPVHVVPRLFEFLDGARPLDHVGGMPILSLGVAQLTRTSVAAKRSLDVILSAIMLLVLAPLMLLMAVAIRLDSRGPVFFRQVRGARGTGTFRLVKFRSMREGAEAEKAELYDANEVTDGVMFKIRRDPRITRVGRVLRRFSLDELPQLWNVLRGDMSLVGPRPLILPENALLGEAWHLRRRDLRPGLTGPWQIYGRSEVSFQDMVRFDYQYVAGWSLARDMEILLATVPAVLSGRGAY